MTYIPPAHAPSSVSSDPHTPYNNAGEATPRLRNLVHNMRVLQIVPWMQEVTFDQVMEMWFYAQSSKPERKP